MDTIRTTKTVLYMEVFLIQRLNDTVKYYCGREQVSLIERFHCTKRTRNVLAS